MDLKDELVLKAATGFGGGVGGRGALCGIISGSVMVIGLKHGRGREDDMSVAINAYLRCSQLLDWFKQEFGSEMCSNLTGGVDFRDPEQLAKFYATGHEKCIEMAGKTAVKLAELLE
ncbi:MAG: C_GCAxxG_C_C family protein [Candidatus Abyssobacteria bacterium SURF_17]|jgi:C_GCAxxG_C_C family probable redox protein|uniref:C_GCAxxG_C_C family protein n=1 Tax=Candidatus Abyssobacteria bacterium SURF_17 TaxID=2093361 RepID=A0A419F8M8_9BACT|nr:MAG: C_GCAxxG_C_C family protein [Candidatus Abyssubacteria bacterium SURF_17]